ncbi:MAG: nucleotidyltransferase domain-containing protein [Actinobacteria bacterium]|nr:nucleotidyltransferase domain-containing protein [Actinomycetota bacterium]
MATSLKVGLFSIHQTDLKSIYIHGSIAFGHFVEGSSDLDILVVVECDRSDPSTVKVVFESLSLPKYISGIELTTVSVHDLKSDLLLKPFRYHVNATASGVRYVSGEKHAGDADLVLHYEVARTVGIPILGPAASDVFLPQVRKVVLEALASELEWALQNEDWPYAVLNASRAQLYIQEGRMCSKLDGWLWARGSREDAKYLDAALVAYLSPRDTHGSPPVELPGYPQWALTYVEDIAHQIREAINLV